jgi:Cytochrome P450
LLDGREVSPEEEEEIKWAASSLYTGGADTVRILVSRRVFVRIGLHNRFFLQPVSAMSSFLLAMTMYPEVQKKCQAELDAAVGNDRLPTFADRESLPYLATMLREVIRWGPTTPLGAPHCVEQDDVHNGYFIPKGSIIMPNIW